MLLCASNRPNLQYTGGPNILFTVTLYRQLHALQANFTLAVESNQKLCCCHLYASLHYWVCVLLRTKEWRSLAIFLFQVRISPRLMHIFCVCHSRDLTWSSGRQANMLNIIVNIAQHPSFLFQLVSDCRPSLLMLMLISSPGTVLLTQLFHWESCYKSSAMKQYLYSHTHPEDSRYKNAMCYSLMSCTMKLQTLIRMNL